MPSVTITVQGLDKLQSAMQNFPAISESHVNMAINRSLVAILGQEKTTAPVNTGNLRDNWSINTGRFTGSLVSNSPYSAAVEFGSRAHMPPASDPFFVLWCKKKGLNPWAVARSIAKHGTKANPFLQKAVDQAAPQINIEFKNALDGIVSDIATQANSV